MAGDLGELLRKAGFAASAPTAEVPAPEPATAEGLAFGPKVVVRVERKGHGGKTVTAIAGIRAGRDEACAGLKRDLGTGARVEGEEVHLQGDQRDRAVRWLEARGAPRVVRG